MRSIRITTGVLLIAAVAAVLLTVGLHTEAILSEHTRRATWDDLRTEVRLLAEAQEGAVEDPDALAEHFANLTARRATLFTPDGRPLADARAGGGRGPSAPEATTLWSLIDAERATSDPLLAAIRLRDGTVLVLSTTSDPTISTRRAIRIFLWTAFFVLSA
ncbi:MAG: hypothetical protein GF393_10750, partial [Armatimonadia bacterium]|nr:hypothetical protein [Armatimonadia bacterium]